jgi:hypothetical protein
MTGAINNIERSPAQLQEPPNHVGNHLIFFVERILGPNLGAIREPLV